MVLPILMYALEAMDLNKSTINNLDNSLNRALFKIFKVNTIENREYCMNMFNINSIATLYNNRKRSFNEKLKTVSNLYLRNLCLI